MNNTTDNKDTKGCSCNLNMGRGCQICGCADGETTAKVCEGCYKLHVTDWLDDYPDNLPNDIYEVRFKNTRRSYYQNVNKLELKPGDIVAVEASPGHDIGIISLTGDMVAKQMRRVGFNPMNGEFKKIYRKAKPYDIEKWQEAMALEHETMIRSRQIAAEMNLNMKIGDVEYQGDKIKAIFYYIADERVDFRELIKVFAEVFHIRVEMKQIGARQEAGRIGGLGSCGRELCCASWISSFMSVTTNSARAQEISLNPQKLAGQCSKLKCCLIYEYDDYMDARKDFPHLRDPLRTLDGEYFLVKNDILARTMSFSTAPNSMAGLVTLPIERVREVMKLNARGIKPDRLENEKVVSMKETDPGFVNVIGEDSITRFDSARKNKKGRNGNNRDKAPRDGENNVKEGENRRDGQRGDRQGNRGGRNNNQGGQRQNNGSAEPGQGDKPRNQGGNQGEGSRNGQRQGNRNRNDNRQRNENRREGQPTEGREAGNRENREGGNNRENRGNGNREGGNNRENREGGRRERNDQRERRERPNRQPNDKQSDKPNDKQNE